MTNALLHGTRHCELRAGLSDAALRLQVIDQGAGMPDPQAASDRDEHGRGLVIVSAVCAAWGVEALPVGGKVVWAEILRPLVEPGGDHPPGRPPDKVASRARNGAPATGDRPGRPNDNRPPSTPQAVARARRRCSPPARAISSPSPGSVWSGGLSPGPSNCERWGTGSSSLRWSPGLSPPRRVATVVRAISPSAAAILSRRSATPRWGRAVPAPCVHNEPGC